MDTGNGATLTRSGFTVDIVAITIGEQRIDMLDRSILADTVFMKKMSADLADAGSIIIEYLYDSVDALVALGGAGVSTIVTWPVAAGQTVAANLTGTAVGTARKYPDFRNNELQNATAEFTWDGITGPTLTVAT